MDERGRRALLNRSFYGLAVLEWLIWLVSAPAIVAISVAAGILSA